MAQQQGIDTLEACRIVRLFFLRGALAPKDVEQLAAELLSDPVTQTFTISAGDGDQAASSSQRRIEVSLLPGVTDPVAENLLRAAHLLNIPALEQAATGHAYLLDGTLSDEDAHRLAVEIFSNPVIQQYTLDSPVEPPFLPAQQVDTTVETVALRTADDDTLLRISSERRLALDLAEMQAIRDYFAQEKRDPTDAELEMLAQTWSEHCVHKTFKATIAYSEPDEEEPQTIHGLLQTYIRGATEKINKPWVRSAFVDNAGIIRFDDTWDLAFKVETHNRPSAIEPFGGANTGVGGVVRDVLGVSARPIANTDILCFAPADTPRERLPEGVLSPRRMAEGIISGIEDYGNKMGIPTVNGAICYHPGFLANPLVFCGCLGLLPRDSHPTEPQAGDLIVVVGGRTGRDGLRGATFSSMAIDQQTGKVAGSAVQIGHPIHEKQVLEVVLRARDEKLYHAITDCGAGGLSSAVGEMGKQLGAQVNLDSVPLKYASLRPWEIWLSEAQERMVLAVAPDQWPRLQEICAEQEIEAVAIGSFEASGRLRLSYGEQQVGDIAMSFLHDGLPPRQLTAHAPQQTQAPPMSQQPLPVQPPGAPHVSQNSALLALLAMPSIRSKEDVVRRYDHEVQGGTAIKPLVGVAGHGPGDSTVLAPIDTIGEEKPPARGKAPAPLRGVALGAGICPQYSALDPYAMAYAAVDEAMRNVVAVGADPDQVALLDNFCWGSSTLPDSLGSLVCCAQGCHDAAVAYNAPFVSGKDSLNNEYMGADGQRHAIPGTLLVSALGIVPDINRTATMDLKKPGNLLYIVGDTRDEMGGSHYHLLPIRQPTSPHAQTPQPVPDALERMRAIHQAIAAGVVQACHDCSEGGLAVALAEMCVASRVGADVELAALPSDSRRSNVLLFSESLCRFVVEVHPDDAPAFEESCNGIACARIGQVNDTPTLTIRGPVGDTVVNLDIAALEQAWHAPAYSPATDEEAAPPLKPGRRPARPRRRKRKPRVLILQASGTNRDRDAERACAMAGGDPTIVHVSQLLSGEHKLLDYGMLVIPGGFSYGDALGAGTLLALDLRYRLGDALTQFIDNGRPVLGICNGFQALVKAGILPGADFVQGAQRKVTLAPNQLGQFECRWVYLQPNPDSPCLFTKGISGPLYCPVAHGEGRLLAADDATLDKLTQDNLITLRYVDDRGQPADYPADPNGSALHIAGLCNAAGNVLGLMPHLENHISQWQHPRWQRGETGMIGLTLFENAIKAVK
jgi:phosphoribosylformylglycinamidine synthase